MKKYKIVADPSVAIDLKEVRDFLNSRRKGYGTKFLKEYRAFLTTMETNPLFQIRYNDIHCLPLKTFKYMVHFTVDEKAKIIHIYAVLSTYQNPEKHWVFIK